MGSWWGEGGEPEVGWTRGLVLAEAELLPPGEEPVLRLGTCTRLRAETLEPNPVVG